MPVISWNRSSFIMKKKRTSSRHSPTTRGSLSKHNLFHHRIGNRVVITPLCKSSRAALKKSCPCQTNCAFKNIKPAWNRLQYWQFQRRASERTAADSLFAPGSRTMRIGLTNNGPANELNVPWAKLIPEHSLLPEHWCALKARKTRSPGSGRSSELPNYVYAVRTDRMPQELIVEYENCR